MVQREEELGGVQGLVPDPLWGGLVRFLSRHLGCTCAGFMFLLASVMLSCLGSPDT